MVYCIDVITKEGCHASHSDPRAEAARKGVSIAALIRQAVDAHLPRNQNLRRRALAAVGRFASGHHAIAEKHDRELEAIYAED
jgi:hypothetical protein